MSLAMPATLACAEQLHPVVVVRVVADVAGDVGLLEAADAVLEAGRAGHGPRPGERLRVALVRPERGRRPWRSRPQMSGRSASVGICHGSEPVARNASER